MEYLLLTKELEENYYALCRFLRDEPLVGRARTRQCHKGKKKQTAKIRRIKEQNCKCKDCDFIFEANEQGSYHTATADHVIPWRYGSNLTMNMEFVCEPCNQAREKNRLQVILNFFGTIDFT